MGFFDEFMTSKHGNIIISIIWGLGLATLFRRACQGRNCVVIKAPEQNEIKGKVFKFDSKCYKFEPEITSCKNK